MTIPMPDPDRVDEVDGVTADLRFDGLGVEQPEADTLDQRRADAGPAGPGGLEPVGELAMEANEADVLGQHEIVPVDDREV